MVATNKIQRVKGPTGNHVIQRCGMAAVLVALIGFAVAPGLVRGQGQSRLTLDQVEQLIRVGTPDNAIAREIQSRGLDFVPSTDTLDTLRYMCAGRQTLQAINKLSNSRGTSPAQSPTLPTDEKLVRQLGTIVTVAGNGTCGYGGDDGSAINAALNGLHAVGVDTARNLYIADVGNNRIRKVDPAGRISTVAGNGSRGYGGDGGAATGAELSGPSGVAVDTLGNLYIADTGNGRIRKVDSSGKITTVAGNGQSRYSGDGGPATGAALASPSGLALDDSQNLYIADYFNNRVRKVDPGGTITTIAGLGPLPGTGTGGYSGDGGAATQSALFQPTAVTVDGLGNVYIADYANHRIRKVDPSGKITTVAGNGMYGYSGDGGPAIAAKLFYPSGVAVDRAGNLYVADSNNHRIRKVEPSGKITTVAGDGMMGYSGDGGPATGAALAAPFGLALDDSQNLYIADSLNGRVRKVNATAANISGSR